MNRSVLVYGSDFGLGQARVVSERGQVTNENG